MLFHGAPESLARLALRIREKLPIETDKWTERDRDVESLCDCVCTLDMMCRRQAFPSQWNVTATPSQNATDILGLALQLAHTIAENFYERAPAVQVMAHELLFLHEQIVERSELPLAWEKQLGLLH